MTEDARESKVSRRSAIVAIAVGVIAALACAAFIAGRLTLERRPALSLGSAAYITGPHGGRLDCCANCFSLREVWRRRCLWRMPLPDDVAINYASPGYATCVHDWRNDQTTAQAVAVPWDTVVLLHSGGRYGAFIIRNQTESHPPSLPGPNAGAASLRTGILTSVLVMSQTQFEWYMRSGGGKMDVSDPLVRHGRTESRDDIIVPGFMPFSTTSKSTGVSWVWYRLSPDQDPAIGSLSFCFTGETDITRIDAADPKWVYRKSKTDPGWSPPAR